MYETKLRKVLISLLGGECQLCGHDESLDFHHVDPELKTASVMKSDNLGEEARLCLLLCANCHRFIHKHKIRLEPYQLPGELGWRHARMKLKKNDEVKIDSQPILGGKPSGRRDKLTVIRTYEQCNGSAKQTCLKLWGSRTPKRLSWIKEIIDEENAGTTQGTSPEA